MLGGRVLGYSGKCTSGTCPLIGNPLRRAIFGAIIGVVLALTLSATGCREETPEPQEKSDEQSHGQIAHVTTSQEFETLVLQADKPVLVDF